ncbi:MAG TPA: M28 family metallopeptidase [Allosphingosinicella sp.]|jgi:Zn-dependent M28 family amino/carboxypeptidase
MRLKIFAATTALLLASASTAQGPAENPEFSAEAFRSHVAFLADDLLEGRNAGERGYDIAASYVATRFEGLGLKQAVPNSWYQQVPFVQASLLHPPTLSIGKRVFTHGQEIIVRPSPAETRQAVEAPVVFAGYGLDLPKFGFNDYRGLDVRGKVVVVLGGFPKGTPSEMGAHLNAEKARMAQERGAIGVITILTREDVARRPWASRIEGSREPVIAWLDPKAQPFLQAPKIRLAATVDTPAAEALFEGSRKSLVAVLDEAAREGAKPRGFALKQRVSFERQSQMTKIQSPNVLAVLPGSDPKLADEYVLLMAHLDHVGINPTREGDKVFNGAMDNASGVATMLEVARAMAASPNRPRRSILFAAVTAEEDGLLGAQYLARNAVTDGKIVGVVNLDMPVLLYDFSDVIAFGAEHSTLGPIVQRAAGRMNVALSPDPLPQEGLFTRSDHYRFVQEGVPSVFLMTGFANGGEKAFKGFLATHYHKPSDDLKLPIDWQAGAKFARINYLIAREIADSADRPRWYSDSFFGRTVAAGQDKAQRPKP